MNRVVAWMLVGLGVWWLWSHFVGVIPYGEA